MSETITMKIPVESHSRFGKGCLICGEPVEINILQINESFVCDKCKAAVMKVRAELEGEHSADVRKMVEGDKE